MNSILTRLLVDLQSDWPFFLYMAMCQWFSICFLKQRRTEAKQIAALRADLFQRLDRLEVSVARQSSNRDSTIVASVNGKKS